MLATRSNVLWSIIIFVFLLSGGIANAQGGYPQPTDNYVNDYAGVLTANDAQNIHTMLAQLEDELSVEATVVTIGSIQDYDTDDQTIESFATHLFNTWGIGNRVENNGVLILVAINDRQVRIELGEGYGREYNPAMQRVIDEHMLPAFRQGNYSGGIYQGARAAIASLIGRQPEVSFSDGRANSSDDLAVRGTGLVINPWAVLGGGVAALVAGGFGVRQYLRYRKRRCPNCQIFMVRLDEVSDDVYLDSGQKVEELLQSVDYDIWKCPNCNHHELHRYGALFSGYKSCPQCGYRTVSSTQETISPATYESSGSARITRDCRNCHFHDTKIVTLPKLTRSDDSGSSGGSSSDSSSFGGGSSSGGGASGSW